MSDPELAALVALYVNSKPERFRLASAVQSAVLPQIELWDGTSREATPNEWSLQARNINPDRLEHVLREFVSGGDTKPRSLFYDTALAMNTQIQPPRRIADIATKSLRRIWTSFSHKYLDAEGCIEPAPIYCAIFDKTGSFLFTGADDWLLRQFDVSTGDLITTFYGHQGEICDMSVSSCNTVIASAAADGCVKLWRFSDRTALCTIPHESDVPWVNFSPSTSAQSLLVTATDSGWVFIWSLASLEEAGGRIYGGYPLRSIDVGGGRVTHIRSFAVSPLSSASGGTFSFAVGSTDKHVRIFSSGRQSVPSLDVDAGKVHALKTITQISFAASSLDFVTSDDAGSVVLWIKGSPQALLSASIATGDCTLPDGSSLLERLKRFHGGKSFCVDMTSWVDEDLRVAVSLGVWAGHRGVDLAPLGACILLFSVRSLELTGIVETFDDRVYVIKPLHNSAMLVESHDGSLAFFSVRGGQIQETNRFRFRTGNRGPRRLLDAAVMETANAFIVGLSDSRGCVSLLGSSEFKGSREQFFIGDYGHGTRTGTSVNGDLVNSRGDDKLDGNELLDELPLHGSGYPLRGRLGSVPINWIPEVRIQHRRPETPVPVSARPSEESERVLNDFFENREYYMDSSFSEDSSADSFADESSSSSSTSLASEDSEFTDDSRPRRRRRIVQASQRRSQRLSDPPPLINDWWLLCDACTKWRKVEKVIFDQYDGTNKRVRCRHIGRMCTEPSDEAAQPEVLPVEEPPISRETRRRRIQ